MSMVAYSEYCFLILGSRGDVVHRSQPALPHRSPLGAMLPTDIQSGEWPMEKFRTAYRQHQQEGDGRKMTVMLSLGAFSPVHLGHVQMMHQAKDRLERAGFCVDQ